MTVRAGSAAPKKDETTGAWWFIVDLGQGADGKRRQARRRGFPTKKAAQEELDKLRRAVTTSTYVPRSVRHSGSTLPRTGSRPSAGNWPPRPGRAIERNVKVHVVPLLTRFYGDLLASGRQRGNQSPGLKPRTVRYIHTILSSALNDAVKWQRLVVNPATRATPPSAGESKAPEMRTWTGSQVRHFLNLCEGDL